MASQLQAQAPEGVQDVSLGYLRAFLVLLVIAHHVATAYAGLLPGPADAFPLGAHGQIWGAFPVVSAQHSPIFLIFLGLNDTFFMSLLFLLSGAYVWRSLQRRGTMGFTAARLLRLGLPFALSALILAPLAYAPAYLQINGGGDISDFLGRWFSAPKLAPGPAWFLWLLLAFDLVAGLLFLAWKGWAGWLGRILPDGARRPARFFGLMMLLSAAAYIPMAAAFGSSAWTGGIFNVQTSRIIHYALYFTVGVALGASDLDRSLFSPAGNLARRWWMWLLVALSTPVIGAVAVAGAMAKGLDPHVRDAIGGIGFVYVCAALSFVFLAVFLRFVRKPNPVMNSLQAHSFGIYLVHYVFVNWLDYALLGPDLPAAAKFAIAFFGAAGLSWATAVVGSRLLGGGRRRERQLTLAHA